MPYELVDHILQFLGPQDLVVVSKTCKFLAEHAKSDLHWQRHVQDNVPGVKIMSPSPCNTYRELYKAHDSRWFVTKYKIWFADYFLTGKVIICRYDPRRGCIEGYRLLAEKDQTTFDPWDEDDEVLIHSFTPRSRVHIDQPVLQLDAINPEAQLLSKRHQGSAQKYSDEVPMHIGEDRNPHGVFSNFMLARPAELYPGMPFWPPDTIPASHRVRTGALEVAVGTPHKPVTRSEASDQTFRIRRWMELNHGQRAAGAHLGEEIHTYSTMDPHLYTPTKDKPWRGIWVGDYSGHGCEFLLMNQSDDEEPFDENSVVQGEDETVEEWEIRKQEERLYRGRIEAIKLTGDPNIPRGQITFVADDIGSKGFIRNITKSKFKGARGKSNMVKPPPPTDNA